MRRRTLLTSAALAAALLLAIAPAALAAPDGDAGRPVTPAAPPSGVSGATATSVATEAEYRAAIIALSADGAGPHTLTITADFTIDDPGDPVYDGDQDLTIDGGGHTVTSGVADTRFLDHSSGAALTIEDLTVDGFDNFDSSGGAIITGAGQLTVTRSTFVNNTSDSDGGAIDFDDAALIQQSTFSSNTSIFGDGGAIDQSSGGAVVIDSSTFDDNSSEGVEGAGDGAAVSAQEDITAVNSTFTGNTGASIIGSTGGESGDTTITLTYVTVASNQVVGDGQGGGNPAAVRNFTEGTLNSFGTAIVNTVAGPSCLVADTDSSYSYSGDDSCDFTGTGDTQFGGNPGLEPLASNGGPTQTMAIGEDGDLFEGVAASACDPGLVTDDQRGEPRPGVGTTNCDIGAFELQLPAPPPPDPGGGGTGGVTDGPGTGPISGRPGFTG
jgi:hypothetical protein